MILRRIATGIRATGCIRAYTSQVTPTVTSSPTRLSAFTGKPDFYEALYFLDDILLQLQPLAGKKAMSITSGQSIQWHDADKLSDAMGFSLSTLHYRKVKDKLAELACYSNLPEIRQLLLNFTADPTIVSIANDIGAVGADDKIVLSKAERVYGHVDDLGRVVAKGRRKTSLAKVYLVDGEGLLYVNGKPAAEYFQRMAYMFKLAEPLRVTSSFGKYNIWALVNGGGLTGN